MKQNEATCKPMPCDPQPLLPPFALDAFLPYRLAVAADVVSKGLAAVYAKRFGISIPEWRIIANLGQHGTLTAGEAALHSSLDKVQVTRALKRLAARRLITRTTTRADRRQVRLTLTTSGSDMLRDIAALAVSWEKELLAVLPDRKRRDFLATLAVLTDHAHVMAEPK